jgi:MFS transporter, PAT family, beta-lactamase induction signal transducer AmpG
MATANQPRVGAPHPWLFAVLYFPYGLTIGFPAIALGFLGRRAGLPTSAIAAVVGMSFLAAGWKFLWAPVGDYTLTRKRWYLLAVVLISAGLIALTVVPLSTRNLPLLSALVLLTSVSGTFLAFATEGLMVHNSSPATRGRAGGWFQSGNQFGQTAGGGVGLWLMSHVQQPWMAGAALALIIACCAIALAWLEEPPRHLHDAPLWARAGDAWRNLRGVLRSRVGRIGLLLAILPIGTGAAAYLFGSLAPEWNAAADTVSLVLGAGGGVAIVAGCFAGGRLADRVSKPNAYALSCGAGLVTCIGIALSPRTPIAFAATTLLYTFTLGMVAASFTALVLALVGHSAPATKINLFFAINSLFSIGVLRANGWAHDHWGTNGMLYTEALLGVGALIVFAFAAGRMRGAVLAEAA